MRLPRAVWVLGFVSLLMDVSSEMIHSLLPVFMVSALGASALAVGLIEGVADATTEVVKLFSGTLSDHWRKRKSLAVAGYGLAAVSKPLFPLAGSAAAVLGARFLDRIGKGIRGAPRDALIADVTPKESRGAAYGLRQALDTTGAIAGPLVALALMTAFAGDVRRVFWWSCVPAFACVLLLVVGLEADENRESRIENRDVEKKRIHWTMLRRFSGAYWKVVGFGALFGLSRFSEAFLILRARDLGLADARAPLVLVVMNVVFALAAYPAGRLADRVDYRWIVGAGMAVMVAADLLLARAGGLRLAAGGVALWGLHLGLVDGVLSAMVAAHAPEDLRGTAFGVFNLTSGLAMLAGSTLAGLLWVHSGAAASFYAGAGLAASSFVMLLI